ncbi:hypothetical protein, partial [Fimbriiglobus ruber]|uniref:hypothetical protein n=1 Tax=Fimbriiglobus ruber TaxID=1908690 RepID=UPI00117BC41D
MTDTPATASSHPLDAERFARRLGVLRTLYSGMMIGTVAVAVGVWMIVWFALDGQPLAGISRPSAA